MLHLADLQAAGATLAGDSIASTFSGIAYDSRMAQPGELFVALRTARADGHEYIAQAVAAGVAGILCARPVDLPGITVLHAADPARVLQRWA
ncbi:MAG TPA: Mur ligase domain-containing protein, partial [Roseiflexaceae bacterium]|nr:Mur ligase domain-containing protein [Roseiflexaceae bacterium]